MKSNVLLLLCLLLSSLYSFSQRGVRIGYVNMDYILENVEEYKEATEQLEAKVQKWKQEIELKQRAVEQLKKDLKAEKVLLTDALIAEREEEIQIQETELLEYQHNRFGPRGDLVVQKQRLIQPIQDQVFKEVQKIGKNKRYDFIFDKSADVVMLYSEKRHDISDLILREIARTRRVNQLQQKHSQQDAEQEAEISEAVQERQAEAAEARNAKARAIEEKKAERLRLREERKKAYETKRQQLLDELEAKRQAKLEARQKAKEQDFIEE